MSPLEGNSRRTHYYITTCIIFEMFVMEVAEVLTDRGGNCITVKKIFERKIRILYV
jgi:hypothetical protein